MRGIINTSYRMIYPFIGAIARGVGVEVGAITLAIAARASLGMASPLLGTVADRWSRRTAMLVALGLHAGGLVLVVVWPTYPALFAALIVSTVGKYLFDPAMQAYLGDRVDYKKRGLAIAVTELGWSGAFIVGIPVAGWLIARGGWMAPFPTLAGLTLLMGIVLWRMLPAAPERREAQVSPWKALRAVAAHSPAVAGLVAGLLICAGNEVVNVVFGLWMEKAFGLQVAALGAASAVIGVAELGGESLVAVLVDQLGKRRAVGLGIGLNAVAGLALPVLGQRVEGALVGLFLFYITFEFTLVSLIPLMTELVPEARATLMAGNVAAFAGGRTLGALIGPGLFAVGMVASSAAAITMDLIALAALMLFVRVE